MMMPRAAGLTLALLLGAVAPAGAANTDPLDAAKDLADKTLSGVAYIPQPTPQPGIEGTPSLKTVMFQAYLRPDGSALVRAWDPAANRYTPTDTRPTGCPSARRVRNSREMAGNSVPVMM